MAKLAGWPGVAQIDAVNTGSGVTTSQLHHLINVTATSSAVAVTLSDCAVYGNGFSFRVRRADGSDADVVVTPYMSQTINGVNAAVVLSQPRQTALLICDGDVNWVLILEQADDDSVEVEVTAAENIAAGDVVLADGGVANSGVATGRNAILGVAPRAISSAAAGGVVISGVVDNVGWSWTPGGKLWLNGDGAMSHTAPTSGFVQQIGVALTATRVNVRLGSAVLI